MGVGMTCDRRCHSQLNTCKVGIGMPTQHVAFEVVSTYLASRDRGRDFSRFTKFWNIGNRQTYLYVKSELGINVRSSGAHVCYIMFV